MQSGKRDAWLARRAGTAALLSLLALASTVCVPTAKAGTAVRLVDLAPEKVERGRIIDGIYHRILPANVGRQSFPLDGAPPKPRLRFSIGLTLETGESGKVQFDVVLRRKTGKDILYTRVLDTTTWVDAEIDLSSFDLSGAELMLRKTRLEGPTRVFYEADWGEPILLPGRVEAAPSVILISLDTLRADHVGVYGNSKARSPTLDALARGGAWYANSYSASTWTYPSHASLLYGLHPSSLPSLAASSPTPDITPAAAAPKPPNLPGVFRSHGYLTAGFTGGGYMSDRWGFTQGFDTYYLFPQSAAQAIKTKVCAQNRFDGPSVFDRAERWLRENATRPFFLFVHTYDVHDRCPVWPSNIGPYSDWPDPGPQGRQKLIDYYDSLVQRADSLVAGLLNEVDSLGLTDRVIVAVTGDHGEGFWEHGYYGHGCSLKPYESLVRVPLIVRAAGKSARRGAIDTPVSAVDVAPTLLALAGLPPPDSMQGHVLPGLGLEGRPDSTPVFVHCENMLAVRVGSHKLIVDSGPKPSEELYDLAKDPGERDNLITKSAAEADGLRRRVSEYRQRGSTGEGSQKRTMHDLDEQTRERLRALGYME